jgi:signal transduction histidine kinase
VSTPEPQPGVDVRWRLPLLMFVLSAGLASGAVLVLRTSPVLGGPALALRFGVPAALGVLVFTALAVIAARRKHRHYETVAARLRHGSDLPTGLTLLDAALAERANASPEADTATPMEPDTVSDPLVGFRHEFRTPLNAVLGFCDVLLGGIDGEINDAQREDLEIIRSSGLKLRNALDNALDLSQLGWGELRLEPERLDAVATLRSAIAEARQMWVERPEPLLRVESDSLVFEGDEARIRRVLVSLMDFLASEFRDATIEIELAKKGGDLRIAIRAQTDASMRLEALPTPDEVLVSEEAGRTRLWPVAVASELVSLHGGALYHGSQPPHFVLRLPLVPEQGA